MEAVCDPLVPEALKVSPGLNYSGFRNQVEPSGTKQHTGVNVVSISSQRLCGQQKIPVPTHLPPTHVLPKDQLQLVAAR